MTRRQGGSTMADKHVEPGGLSPEELEAESAEALPERAAMSTLSMTGLDAATGTAEAVSDGMSGTADAVDASGAGGHAPEPHAAPVQSHGQGAAHAAAHSA